MNSETLEDRLIRLERNNAALRRMVLTLSVIIAAVFCVGAAPNDGVCRVERLEIVDRLGNVKAALFTGTNGDPKLTMNHGPASVLLAANRGGYGELHLNSGDGSRHASSVLFANHDTGVTLQMFHNDDNRSGPNTTLLRQTMQATDSGLLMTDASLRRKVFLGRDPYNTWRAELPEP